jgi:hypothetical protein
MTTPELFSLFRQSYAAQVDDSLTFINYFEKGEKGETQSVEVNGLEFNESDVEKIELGEYEVNVTLIGEEAPYSIKFLSCHNNRNFF